MRILLLVINLVVPTKRIYRSKRKPRSIFTTKLVDKCIGYVSQNLISINIKTYSFRKQTCFLRNIGDLSGNKNADNKQPHRHTFIQMQSFGEATLYLRRVIYTHPEHLQI